MGTIRTAVLLLGCLLGSACGADGAPVADGPPSPSASPSYAARPSVSPPPRPDAASVPAYEVFHKLSNGSGNHFSVAVTTDDSAELQLVLEDIRAQNARSGQHRITFHCRTGPPDELGVVGYGRFAFGASDPASLRLADGATEVELAPDASCSA